MRRAGRKGAATDIGAELLEDVAQELAIAHGSECGVMPLEDGFGGPALFEFVADHVCIGAKGDSREAAYRP